MEHVTDSGKLDQVRELVTAAARHTKGVEPEKANAVIEKLVTELAAMSGMDEAEVAANPRAASVRLRAAERLDPNATEQGRTDRERSRRRVKGMHQPGTGSA